MSLRKRKRENSDSRIVNEETEEIEVREKLVDGDNDSYQFHHPKDKETTVPGCSFSLIGLPLRPGAPVCAFYFRTGICRDGPTCIFDHPSLFPTHKNASSMASETLHLSPLGFSSSIGDSSSELVEASTKKPRIHKNASSMASETLHLGPLGFSSSVGHSSSELVEASTKQPIIHKNASSMASETLHLGPLGFSILIGDSSSERVETSTVSEITQANVGRDIIDSWGVSEEDIRFWLRL